MLPSILRALEDKAAVLTARIGEEWRTTQPAADDPPKALRARNGAGAGASIEKHLHFHFFEIPDGHGSFPIQTAARLARQSLFGQVHGSRPAQVVQIPDYPLTAYQVRGSKADVVDAAVELAVDWDRRAGEAALDEAFGQRSGERGGRWIADVVHATRGERERGEERPGAVHAGPRWGLVREREAGLEGGAAGARPSSATRTRSNSPTARTPEWSPVCSRLTSPHADRAAHSSHSQMPTEDVRESSSVRRCPTFQAGS